jgi:hypothetical protein
MNTNDRKKKEFLGSRSLTVREADHLIALSEPIV